MALGEVHKSPRVKVGVRGSVSRDGRSPEVPISQHRGGTHRVRKRKLGKKPRESTNRDKGPAKQYVSAKKKTWEGEGGTQRTSLNTKSIPGKADVVRQRHRSKVPPAKGSWGKGKTEEKVGKEKCKVARRKL